MVMFVGGGLAVAIKILYVALVNEIQIASGLPFPNMTESRTLSLSD